MLTDDWKKRGTPNPKFKIVCDCGADRKFVIDDSTYDIFPCSRCRTSGITNKEVKNV